MTYGLCNLSLISLRSEPSHRSEQVSQVLFGEHFTIIDHHQEWIRIKMAGDNYEGWILNAQIFGLTHNEFTELEKTPPFLSYDLVQILVNHEKIYSVVLGSTLPWYRAGSCRLGNDQFKYDGNGRYPDLPEGSKSIVENAFMYLQAPYLWGGRSPFGIDCSGLTQMVYKLSGFNLKRDAWMQAENGETVHLLDEAQPGELAFFDNEEGKIIHVGILIAKNRIIHASGKVRIDNIDHHGIFNAETRKYTHNLRLIKRIL